jgi:hypothetical protein
MSRGLDEEKRGRRVEGHTFGRPKCVGDLREVMASVSAPTSLTRMLFILSSLSISTAAYQELAQVKSWLSMCDQARKVWETYSIFAVR